MYYYGVVIIVLHIRVNVYPATLHWLDSDKAWSLRYLYIPPFSAKNLTSPGQYVIKKGTVIRYSSTWLKLQLRIRSFDSF
jgi:hypothetical protein